MGLDSVVFLTAGEELVVRRTAPGELVKARDLRLAERAAREFRFALALGDASVAEGARRLLGLSEDVDARSTFGTPLEDAFLGRLAEAVERELRQGSLVVERHAFDALRERDEGPIPSLAPPPSPAPEANTHSFEVRFVDEAGKAISGVDSEFFADGPTTIATNAAGLALLEGVSASSATVAIVDTEALAEVLEPRWESLRPGTLPAESNTREVVFEGRELGPFPLKAEVPHRVVIKPPLGKLFVELFDKSGRVRHAKRTFQISGPQSFEGTTDERGVLLIENVFPGDYQLSLALDFFENDPDRVMDIVESQLVVLPAGAPKPEVRMLGIVPRSVLARLHMSFNTNKAFLLPNALPSLRVLRKLYLDNAPCKLLVVGHADTKAGASHNEKLSLERAKATIAYLKDDVDAWYKFYQDPDPKKRWGRVEDHLMIIALPDFRKKPAGEDEVEFFQRTRGLEVDGDAGTETRHALIEEYMSLDGTSLQDFIGEIEAIAHGCGENFPLDDRGEDLDETPTPEKRDHIDRRVELFFFDREFGVTPAPPGEISSAGSVEYPRWRDRAVEVHDLSVEADGARLQLVEVEDVLFQTNSAVPLPEPENADGSGVIADGAGAIHDVAAALRFAFCYPNKLTLVAGHADTTGDPSVNDPLSELRALSVLALYVGDRDLFGSTVAAKNVTSDRVRVLEWAERRFEFGCAPKRFGGNMDKAVRAFQSEYNDSERGGNAEAPALEVDGDFGPLTWKAVFDLYEGELADLLQGDRELLAEYRKNLHFVDEAKRSMGFGERFPVDELGRDNIRSAANRRVEILFFDPKDKPDLEAPLDMSDIYLPGVFVHEPQPVNPSKLEIVPVRAARLPTRFSNGRTFPKPSALPALSELAKLAVEGHTRLVVVGHTDHNIKNDANASLALARADAVAALLRQDKDFFLKRFQEPDPIKTWNWEEVQWMLSAVRVGEERCYVGLVDDHPGDVTRAALGTFQLHSQSLEVDYGCDQATLSQLIDRYFELLNAPAVPADAITTVSAGSWHPPRTFTKDAALEDLDGELSSVNRRVEVFVFDQPIVPGPETIVPSSRIESPTYRRWCRSVALEIAGTPAAFPIRVFDAKLVPVGGAALRLSKHVTETGELGATTSLTTNAFGSAEFTGEVGSYQLTCTAQGRTHVFALSLHPDEIGGFAAILPHGLF